MQVQVQLALLGPGDHGEVIDQPLHAVELAVQRRRFERVEAHHAVGQPLDVRSDRGKRCPQLVSGSAQKVCADPLGGGQGGGHPQAHNRVVSTAALATRSARAGTASPYAVEVDTRLAVAVLVEA